MPITSAIALVAVGSVFIQAANLAASATCLDPLVTAVADPPQLPGAGLAGSHCGSGAIFHLPAVDAALPSRTPGAQIALTQPTCVPSFSAAFQAGVYIGLLSMEPLATS